VEESRTPARRGAAGAEGGAVRRSTGEDGEAAGAGRRGWPAMRARVAGDVGRPGRIFLFSLFRWRIEEDLCVVKKKFLGLFTK
jgi:hypothetical protein